MTIVLLILKIIGILLLAILGLLLFALLAALLIPARYRAWGEFREKGAFRIKVSWFLSVFAFRIEFDGELKQRFSIFGIPVRIPAKAAAKPAEGSLAAQQLSETPEWEEARDTGKASVHKPEWEEAWDAGKASVRKPEWESESTRDAEKASSYKAAEEIRTETAEAKPDSEEAFIQELEAGFRKQEFQKQERAGNPEDITFQAGSGENPETVRQEEAGKLENMTLKAAELLDFEPDGTEEPEQESSPRPCRKKGPGRFFQKIKHFFGMIRIKWETLKETPRRFKRKLRQLKHKWGRLKQKAGRGLAELKREENRNAAAAVFRELKYLLSHVSPRKIKGDVAFGTDDPALTGQILGGISILPFFYRYQVSVRPDFASERYYLKGELSFKGHARMVHVLVSGFRLLKDRNIRSIIRRYRSS